MSKYLVKTTEQWRCDTEGEAKALIEAAKKENYSELSKYSSEVKEVKIKGEVVETYVRVTLTKAFTSEKEPDMQIGVTYEQENAFNHAAARDDEDEVEE